MICKRKRFEVFVPQNFIRNININGRYMFNISCSFGICKEEPFNYRAFALCPFESSSSYIFVIIRHGGVVFFKESNYVKEDLSLFIDNCFTEFKKENNVKVLYTDPSMGIEMANAKMIYLSEDFEE